MVLPPSVADDAPGSDLPGWLRRLKVVLELSRAGVLVLVDHARPERLGELVRALLPAHPELEVYTEARRLVDAEPGATLVLVPQVEDADWLNINRPLFASRALRVVLFCPRETSVALARGAVDFFDWISHRLECPTGPVPFAVGGIRKALAIRVPGIVWTGGDLEVSFAAARPHRAVRRISAARPYEELVAETKAGHQDWLAWTEVDGDFRLRRVRWALAEARRRTRTILVEPTVRSPGWWEVHGRVRDIREAREHLERKGARNPGRLAALVDLEPEAIELLGTLLQQGADEKVLESDLMAGPDPGAAVGRLAIGRGLVAEEALVRGKASPPVLRAFSEERSRVRQLQKGALEVLSQRMQRGEQLAAEDAAWWAASMRMLPPWQFWQLSDSLGGRGDAAEALLRNVPRTVRIWRMAAFEALGAEDMDVASLWIDRAETEAEWLRQVLEKVQVAALSDHGATLHELASELERQGRFTDAERLLRQIPSIMEKEQGVPHPVYGASLYLLAVVLGRQGKYTEEEGVLRQALVVAENAWGPAHAELCSTLTLLGFNLVRQGRSQEGEPFLLRALEIARGTLGEHHLATAQALRRLAQAQAASRKPEAAETARQAVEALLKAMGPEHPITKEALPELQLIMGENG